MRTFNLMGYKIDGGQWYYDDQPVNNWNAHMLPRHRDVGAGPFMRDLAMQMDQFGISVGALSNEVTEMREEMREGLRSILERLDNSR